MSDLVGRLRIKAGMIEMGERIEWGSDTALMREAADALEAAAHDHIAGAGKVASEIHTQLAGLRGILWSPDWRTSQAREEMSDITSEIERIILAQQPAEQLQVRCETRDLRVKAEAINQAINNYFNTDSGPHGLKENLDWQAQLLRERAGEEE